MQNEITNHERIMVPAFQNKTVLVTGGAGMIGSHLVIRILREGAKVIVLDDLSSGKRELLPSHPNLKFIEGDINDPVALEESFKPNIDFVFHLAALFANQNSVENPEKDMKVNGLGTLQVLEKSRQRDVRRVVYASSSCVYPTNTEKMDESIHDSSVATPYAISKFVGERYCKYFQSHLGLPITIVRFFNGYGPHEFPGKYRNVIPNFLQRALEGKTLTVHGDGSATRDFTYVEDAVAATCLAAVRSEAIGQTFNIGTGKETTIKELAEKINKLTGNTAGIEYVPVRDWDKVIRRSAEYKKARELLGFLPRHELDQGLLKTYNWLKTTI